LDFAIIYIFEFTYNAKEIEYVCPSVYVRLI
jgi:hypothetical protein